MKYFRVKWKHSNPDEPVWLFSEFDDDGRELRKIECFRNGFCDYATPTESTGHAALSTRPIPDLSAWVRDPEFEPIEITAEEFENVWKTRRYP